ncbi:MAG TPA: hypothetical protein VHJ20_20945 [Polyangia bacterium]|nr:hypothetical protein [Polyangia bacterium]
MPSHFNAATPLDTALFAIMGVGITIFWIAELFLAVQTFRQPFTDATRAWGIRLGLVATLLGGAIGAVMTNPTPAQVAELRASGQPTMVGGHAVGVPTAVPACPSRAGAPRAATSARAVVGLGVAWIGMTIVLHAQALRAQPLIEPDGLTILGVVLAVIAGVVMAAWPTRRAARLAPAN